MQMGKPGERGNDKSWEKRLLMRKQGEETVEGKKKGTREFMGKKGNQGKETVEGKEAKETVH